MKINNLFLVNFEFFALKTEDNFIPEIKSPISNVEKIPNFELNLQGSELIFLTLNNEREKLYLIIQYANQKYTILFPEEIKSENGYKFTRVQIINFPELKLSPLKETKKNELRQLYMQYSNKEIDDKFLGTILENSIVLPDNELIISVILDQLDLNDLKNLYLINSNNKEKVKKYLIDKIKKDYELVIKEINFSDIIWLYSNVKNYELKTELPYLAVKNNNLDILKKLYNLGIKLDIGIIKNAILYDRLDILKWLYNLGFKLDEKDANFAASYGFLDILIWLHQLGIIPNVNGANAAADYGHMNVLKWMKETLNLLPGVDGTNAAAENSLTKVLEWLYQFGIKPTVLTANRLARQGNLDMLKWMKSNIGVAPDVKGANEAFSNRHTYVLRWMRDELHIVPNIT